MLTKLSIKNSKKNMYSNSDYIKKVRNDYFFARFL